MEIGNQIRALRLRRGATQEEVARHVGVTAQAVSKWERNTAVPDIGLLPGLSAYFGVSIDELFALSDETRMERIQNMLWDVRFLNPAEAENERQFLLEKARREPQNSQPHEMLANLALHMAQEQLAAAEYYALEAIARNPHSSRAHCALAHAMSGKHVDPRNNTHNRLISHYKQCLAKHPDTLEVYPWLIEQLLDDGRLAEAQRWCDEYTGQCSHYLADILRIKLLLAQNHVDEACARWTLLGEKHPHNWSIRHWIGDFQARTGNYADAKISYRQAIDMQHAPQYTDPLDSLAQVCEMDGDLPGAIAAREEELAVCMQEWHDCTGESLDFIRREIARLKSC